MRAVLSKVIGSMTLFLASASMAQAPDKRPEVPKSIANVGAAHLRNGPLFSRAQAAFAAAKEGGAPALAAFLTENAKMEFSTYSSPQAPLHQPLNIQLLRAIMDSCDGPLSYDEGSDWVQLNWVCRVDEESSLAHYYTFRNSPEIVMQIEFDASRIARVQAVEPFLIPGTLRLTMDAYAVAHSKH